MKLKEVNLEGETIYLKKDWTGWRTVDPIKDPHTKKFIWKNLFNKKGLLVLGFILLILGLGYLGFKEQINNYRTVMDEPCKFCKDSIEYQYKDNINPSIPGEIDIYRINYNP